MAHCPYRSYLRPLVCALAISAVGASAAGAAPSESGVVSEAYQLDLIRQSLKERQLQLEPSPQGQRIAGVVISGFDVFTAGDPWPSLLNSLHAQTRPEVVQRELLFKTGDQWSSALVDETERNLRQLLFLGVAEIVACRGTQPGEVIALVVVKDLWSLRLDTNFSYVASSLENLDLELSESNLGGWNRKAGILYSQDLASRAVGAEFVEPRLLGSRIAVSEAGRLIYNRGTGRSEGGVESFSIGQPLYSLETPWAWNVSLGYRRDIYRYFIGGELAEVRLPTGELLPYSFSRNRWDANASVTRSYGSSVKQNISLGWHAFTPRYGLPGTPLPVSALTVAEFGALIPPRSENVSLLFLQYHRYEPRYLQLEDIDTYALTEDFRLGLDVTLEARVASTAFGLDATFWEAALDSGYAWDLGDDLLRASATAQVRHQTGVWSGSEWVNEALGLGVSNVSPRWGWFRLHAQAGYNRRAHDLNHGFDTLGGDSLLRGYPSGYFQGPNSWHANLELRTLPVEFRTVYLGGAAFLDTGDAFGALNQMSIHESVGFGARLVFPQFNRAVLRFDLGFPLGTLLPEVSPVLFVAQFGQAFD